MERDIAARFGSGHLARSPLAVHAPKSAVSHSVIRAPASLAAKGDVVFERETGLRFLFVRSGMLARRRRRPLEDLYSFR